MDVTEDSLMETDAMPEVPQNAGPVKEDGSAPSNQPVNGASLEETDTEKKDDRAENERLFDLVFGNHVIFREFKMHLSFEELTNFRLVRRSANDSVLKQPDFATSTTVVVDWTMLKNRVLDQLQFPLTNVKVHLFRAAGTPSVSKQAADAIYGYRGENSAIKTDQETWQQIWDPDDERLTRLYDLFGSVKQLRIVGVPSVDSDVMDTRFLSSLQILPSVPRLLARIEKLQVLQVEKNLNHWSRTMRSQKPSVSPEDAGASKGALAHVKQFKFVGLEALMLKTFTNLKSLEEITAEMCPGRSLRVDDRKADETIYHESMKELADILAVNEKSLRVLKFDDDSFQPNFIRTMFERIATKNYSALKILRIEIRPKRELVFVLYQFVARIIKQLSGLTIKCLPSGERRDMMVPPAISFIQEVFFDQMGKDCRLEDLQIITEPEYGFDRVFDGFRGSYPGFAALRNCSKLKKLKLDVANCADSMSGIFQFVPPSVQDLRLCPFLREEVHQVDAFQVIHLGRLAWMKRN